MNSTTKNIKQMKRIIILLIAITVIISCKSKHEDYHDHEKEQSKIVKSEKDKGDSEEHSENEIHLNSTQIKSANIQTDSIRERNIRERIEVTGSIEVPPQSKATVYAPLEAFVYKTDLLPGDKVQKGQTVAVLQHPNFTNLQYNYLEAINKHSLAKSEYDRKKMLFEKDIASKKSFQMAQSVYLSAKSLVDSYASQLKMAGISPTTVKNSGIQQYVYVKAPISGYVVENNLNKGKFLEANSEMMEIIDNDHKHAELNVFGSDISRLKIKDEFVFKPNGIDKEYNGYIKLISQKVNDQTKTVNVHGHFEDEQQLLRAGTFINAEILLGGENKTTVPEEAIVDIEGEKFIFMAESNEEFIPLEVTIGSTDNGFTELKTIQENNFNINIVTSGAHFLKGELLKKAGGMEGHAH